MLSFLRPSPGGCICAHFLENPRLAAARRAARLPRPRRGTDIAALCGAHGLHVGQTDLPVAEARRVLPPHQLVGRSNNNMEEAMASQANGADYIAVGAVFPTSTMGKGQRNSIGVEFVTKAKERVSQPVVAIGGIDATNITDVAKAGADCICVVSAVTFADSPEDASKGLVEAIQNARQ